MTDCHRKNIPFSSLEIFTFFPFDFFLFSKDLKTISMTTKASKETKNKNEKNLRACDIFVFFMCYCSVGSMSMYVRWKEFYVGIVIWGRFYAFHMLQIDSLKFIFPEQTLLFSVYPEKRVLFPFALHTFCCPVFLWLLRAKVLRIFLPSKSFYET